jgi:hypothetical protein
MDGGLEGRMAIKVDQLMQCLAHQGQKMPFKADSKSFSSTPSFLPRSGSLAASKLDAWSLSPAVSPVSGGSNLVLIAAPIREAVATDVANKLMPIGTVRVHDPDGRVSEAVPLPEN